MKLLPLTACLLLATAFASAQRGDDDGRRNPNDMDRRPPMDGDRPRDGPRDGPMGGDGGDGPDGRGDGGETERPPRVWLFAMSRDMAPLAFMDMQRNQVVGLGVDMISLACQAEEQQCEFIFLHPEAMDLCWHPERGTSAGLWNRWWDGCVNFEVTPDRAMVNAFSRSFAREPPSALYKRSNDNLIIDDLRREGNELPIGYVQGTTRNPMCLMRSLRLQVNMDLARDYESEQELVEALRSGEIRVGFMSRQEVDTNIYRMMDTGDMEPRCAERGPAVMTRKGERGLLRWLDRGLDHVMSMPGYSRVCYIWAQISGKETNCLEPGMDGGMGDGQDGRPDGRPGDDM